MIEKLLNHAVKQIMRSSKRSMLVADEALIDWFKKERKSDMIVAYSFLLSLNTSSNAMTYAVLLTGCNMSGTRLQGAACILWSTMKDHFTEDRRPEPAAFSDGWLHNFKRQCRAQLHVGYGESGSVN